MPVGPVPSSVRALNFVSVIAGVLSLAGFIFSWQNAASAKKSAESAEVARYDSAVLALCSDLVIPALRAQDYIEQMLPFLTEAKVSVGGQRFENAEWTFGLPGLSEFALSMEEFRPTAELLMSKESFQKFEALILDLRSADGVPIENINGLTPLLVDLRTKCKTQVQKGIGEIL